MKYLTDAHVVQPAGPVLYGTGCEWCFDPARAQPLPGVLTDDVSPIVARCDMCNLYESDFAAAAALATATGKVWRYGLDGDTFVVPLLTDR